MIRPYDYDRLMRFVRASFAADYWVDASLALLGEGPQPAEWFAARLERLIRQNRWQDPARQPWRRSSRPVGELVAEQIDSLSEPLKEAAE